MNIWKTLPKYPTREDVLYELCMYVEKNLANKEFSELTFNGIWYDTGGVANWKGTRIEEHINEMFANGTFVMSRDQNGKTWFKVANNPFN